MSSDSETLPKLPPGLSWWTDGVHAPVIYTDVLGADGRRVRVSTGTDDVRAAQETLLRILVENYVEGIPSGLSGSQFARVIVAGDPGQLENTGQLENELNRLLTNARLLH